jgi:hypothetical protein
MARFRVDLQPAKNVSGLEAQPGSQAARVGSARNGVCFLHVFQAPGATGLSFLVQTASSPDLGDGSTAGNYWVTLATQAVSMTSGTVYRFTITNLGEVIRWKLSGSLSSEFSFSLVVFLCDQ